MAKKEQILELLNAYKSEVDNFNDAVFTDKFEVLSQDIVKLFAIPVVGCSKNTGINQYKLGVISDALRLVKNYRNDLKLPETCLDRQVKLAKEFVDDAIS